MVKVHVAHAARSEIYAWARQAELREIGGILLGRVHTTAKGPLVRVEAALLAESAGSVGSSIRFTPELLASLRAEARVRYPSFEVVGWFHTHSGLGAFLSGYDATVHKEHFSKPWQVALVLDAELGREALYVWEGGEIVPFATSPPATPVGTALRESAATAVPSAAKIRYRLTHPRRFYACLLLGLLLCAALAGLLWRRAGGPVPANLPVQSPSAEPQAAGPAGVTPSPKPAAAGGSFPSQAGPAVTPGTPAGQRYIVKPNDTLWGISERFLGQGALYPKISEYNRLANPRLLHPGDVLVLPPESAEPEETTAGGAEGPAQVE